MAKKISQLTQATEVKSDDVTVIVQDGETKKLPLNMMVTKQDIENKKVTGLAKLDEIEATYENDTYTPTITVKNKSSVKVGEGDEVDYSANVMDGHVKSAILKGQTLVNVLNYSFRNNYSNVLVFNIRSLNNIKPLTSYLMYIIDETNKVVGFNISNNNSNTIIGRTDGTKTKVTTNDFILNNQSLYIYPKNGIVFEDSDVNKIKIMLIEYQDGMENWDIPYFEGMQSVKMPVLTTTGKNLFDIKNIDKFYQSTNNVTNTYKIRLKPNTNYTMSSNVPVTNPASIYFNGTKTDMNGVYINAPKTAMSDNDGNLIFYIRVDDLTGIKLENFINNDYYIQLEEGSNATSYEPFKSNILTVNEDVTLRGNVYVNGELKEDTLDLVSGEHSISVGEAVLNGSENWSVWYHTDTLLRFMLGYSNMSNLTNIKLQCDKIPSYGYNQGVEGLYGNGGRLYLIIDNSNNKLSGNTANDLKTYLSLNPITIHYPLKEKSIKTVDLMPSGTHPSTTPYCWKNGHIQLSSSGLLPSLEYSVVTSRAGQINQNATMIVKNDKRIFDLEILLAGGLVNTTYQALTLQNQVETGLSKVSLNSETEPDYLLYHMIMKLIEEKAYKLDDLTEKVSVFYLYEKLSDEQFETIYSALYPFVEDEIVEEPVVEELPEVVEDEVIM